MAIDPSAAALYENDPSAAFFGIELLGASPTEAVVQMTVTESICNGYSMVHGGMSFLLADSAMAFASNSGLGDGERALATSATIDWTAPAPVGTVLTARCRHVSGSGRSRIWDIDITDGNDTIVGRVRGRTRTLST